MSIEGRGQVGMFGGPRNEDTVCVPSVFQRVTTVESKQHYSAMLRALHGDVETLYSYATIFILSVYNERLSHAWVSR